MCNNKQNGKAQQSKITNSRGSEHLYIKKCLINYKLSTKYGRPYKQHTRYYGTKMTIISPSLGNGDYIMANVNTVAVLLFNETED